MPASGTSTVAVPLTAEPPTGERVAVQLVTMGLASANRSPAPAHSVSLRDSIFPSSRGSTFTSGTHSGMHACLAGWGRWRRNAAPAPSLLERQRHKPPPDMKRGSAPLPVLLRAYGLGAVVSRGGICIWSPPPCRSPQEMTALSDLDFCTLTE